MPLIALLKMEGILDNVVALVKQYPAGIPLKKFSVFYNQTYRQNLTLYSLGFNSMASLVAALDEDLVVEGELVIHKSHCRARQPKAMVPTKATKHSKTMEVLENIVAMVKHHSAGIPLKKLAVSYMQTYQKNLTLSSLGFNSMVSLVASLDRDLVLVGQLVLHKDHCCESQAGAGASTKATEDNERIEKVLENVVAIIKEHPDGIPLKMVAIVYSQKYHHNLVLASLGFNTISCLVASLKGDLVVRKEVVFHKIHQRPSGPVAEKSATMDSRPATTPQKTESLKASPSVTVPQVNVTSPHVPPTKAGMNILGPPLISTASLFSSLFTMPQPAETLTEQQLYQRVIEVSYEDKIDHRVFVI